MIFLFAFWLFLLGALTIGWQAGDRHDRAAIAAIGAAAALTTGAQLSLGASAAVSAVGVIDLVLLAIVVRYALAAKRHWPMWFAGFHATGMICGLAALLIPEPDRYPALLVSGFWSIPALAALALGLLSDQRLAGAGKAR